MTAQDVALGLSRTSTGAPFDLTPMQQAYWIGRRTGQSLGGVGCHAYLEFDGPLVDPERLRVAAEALVRRHGMLRARFLPDCRQQIMESSAWPGLTVNDLRGLSADRTKQELERLRDRLSRRRFDPEHEALFDIQLSLASDNRSRLHVDVDLLVADVYSVQIMLADLARLYLEPDKPLPAIGYEFSDYLAERRASAPKSRDTAARYWTRTIPTLPGRPALPVATDPDAIDTPTFARQVHKLDASTWQRLVRQAGEHGVTPAMALATAYAEALGAWSAEKRFLLNVPVLGRWTTDPRVRRMVGDFSNLVLVPADVSIDQPFAQRACELQQAFRSGLANSMRHYGVEVLREMRKGRPDEPGPAPVVFTYAVTGGDLVDEKFRRTFGEPAFTISQTPQVWLDHQAFQNNGELTLKWDYVDELFPPGVVRDMFDSYARLVGELAESADAWSRSARPALPEHQRRARHARNSTAGPESGALLHEAFFARAAERPERPALVPGEGEEISYGQLADTALRIAASLAGLGVRQGEPVVVSLPRGPEQIAAVLGILAAGGAYVPVGTEQPADRRRRIAREAGVRYVLAGDGTSPADWEPEGRVVRFSDAITETPLPQPLPGHNDQPAYVIYTSGSTGVPKGVELSHRAPVNTIESVNDRYGVSGADRVLAVSALDFDLSVYDIFGILGAGGALVLIGENDRGSAEIWLKLVDRHGVTVWNSVPAMLDMLLTASDDRPLPATLRLALASGDWVGTDLPARLARASRARCRLVALGGATEAAIWSNSYEAEAMPDGWPSIPYGHPLRNQRHRVVDRLGHDCPDWVPGELWIGGVGLANGYRGDPTLTAERFVHADGERWYRTGDLVRYRPGGTLEFLGRTDHQVKIQGYRVELGEVETALRVDPRVAQAVAVATGKRLTRRLTAFVVPADDTVDVEELRASVEQRLPSYEVPARIFVLEDMPLTPNGKVDRKTLTDWATTDPSTDLTRATDDPPRPGWEEKVAAEWSRLLGCPVMRRDDNFFDLGGNSVLATRLASSLRTHFGAELTVRDLFDAHTVSALAELLARIARPS